MTHLLSPMFLCCFFNNYFVLVWISSEFIIQICLQPAHEKIGVVDSQWIVHQTVPSLGSQVRGKFSPLSLFHVLSNQFLEMGSKYLVHLFALVG